MRHNFEVYGAKKMPSGDQGEWDDRIFFIPFISLIFCSYNFFEHESIWRYQAVRISEIKTLLAKILDDKITDNGYNGVSV